MSTPARAALALPEAPANPPPPGVPGRPHVPPTLADPMPLDAEQLKVDGNPFNDRDWRMSSYAWTGFLLRLFLVFGAFFSVYEYMAAREEKRVERTLALVELWERPEYQDAQKALKQRIAALNQANAGLLAANPALDELAIFQDRIGLAALTQDGGAMALPDFREHFDRIVYFLNRVASCVEANLCSRTVADDYFRDYARSFWAYFAGFIAQERKNGSPSFAAPIEAYVIGAQSASKAPKPAPPAEPALAPAP